MAITIPKKGTTATAGTSETGRTILNFLKKINNASIFQKKVSTADLGFFTYQLAMMLETDIPINTSILTIADQVKNPGFKVILTDIVKQIEKGKSLYETLKQYPDVFSNVYVSMVQAGEVSGNLKEMLDRQMAFQSKRDGIFSALKSAMAYPIFLLIASIGAIIFILMVVFPKFGPLFEEIRDQLPITTRFLLSISHGLTHYLWIILFVVSGVSILIFKLLSSRKGRIFLDHLSFAIPVLNDFLIKFYVSQLMRTLGTLLGSGVLLLEAINVSRGVVAHSLFIRFMGTLTESVEGGRGMASAVEKATFFPQIVKQMIRTGEDTGNLSKSMTRIADYYDDELDKALKVLSSVLEPVLLMMMGIVVGTVVISLILPIFKLTKSMH